MYKEINSLEIPNEVGFNIALNTILACFDSEKDKKEFMNKFLKKTSFLSDYGENLNIDLIITFSIQSFDGEKYFKISEFGIINTLYIYFNAEFPFEKHRLYFNNSINNAEIDEKIGELKEFLNLKIKQLQSVKSIDDLKEISLNLYNSYYCAYLEDDLENLMPWDVFFESELKKDIQSFKKIKLWLSNIIKDVSKPLNEQIFENINIDKLKLFLATQYLILSPIYKEPIKSILYDASKKIYNSIKNKNICLENIQLINYELLDNNEIEFKINKIEKLNFNLYDDIFSEKVLTETLLGTPFYENLYNLDRNLFAQYNFSDISNYIEEIINNNGGAIIDESEMDITIDALKQEIQRGNLSLDEYKKKKHQLQKLKMVFEEIKPKAIQKGLDVFEKFNVYYYDNGMVAIDKIEYGARLFIMPITTYKYIIENKISSLRGIGKLEGVRAFKHDERTDWLSNARNLIINGNQYTSMEDIKLNEEMISWEFDFSEDDISRLDKMVEEIQNNNNYTNDEKAAKIKQINKVHEKKKLKRKKAKEIDLELKQSKPEEDLKISESREIIECEAELDLRYGNGLDFQTLYEEVKKIEKKYKRNPAVSKYCKDRTIDANGMYHCEMCDNQYAIEEKSRLDFHHFIPIGENGPDTIYNGLCLCTECHRIIHFEKERISAKAKIEFLRKIEKHIIEENPELLEEFYDYRKKFFPTINDILYRKRLEIKQQLKEEGISLEEYGEELVSNEIDKRIENFEKELQEEYELNPKKYDENFDIDWNSSNCFRK